MKLTITNGVVTAQSENKKEALMLVELSFKEESEEKTKAVRKPRYACEICGKKSKGKKGLGIHKYFTHGIKSPLHEKNRLFREKQLAQKASDVFPFK